MPDYIPDKETSKKVEQWSAVINQDQIAIILGIDPKTLRKYYREELDTGKAKANAEIGQTLYQKAIDGDTTAMIWWTKAQMRWSETKRIEGNLGITDMTEQQLEDKISQLYSAIEQSGEG